MGALDPWPDSIVAGEVEQLSPRVRRVLAPNPSPYTYTGTQSFIVGAGGDVAVIDPGPAGGGAAGHADTNGAGHVEALLRAIGGARLSTILVTHTHRDHSPASRALKAATGAPIIGCVALTPRDGGEHGDAAFDPDYAPDRVLGEGERVAGEGWTLEALATPGHTSNHLCFALLEERALFTGDHVMKWSTSVVSPPDGDMGAYMASLDKLYARDDVVYYPAHGPAVDKPRQLVRGMIGHRRSREAQILRRLAEGAADIPMLVATMYKGLDPRLTGAAGRSVLAHLIDLERRALVRADGEVWRLA